MYARVLSSGASAAASSCETPSVLPLARASPRVAGSALRLRLAWIFRTRRPRLPTASSSEAEPAPRMVSRSMIALNASRTGLRRRAADAPKTLRSRSGAKDSQSEKSSTAPPATRPTQPPAPCAMAPPLASPTRPPAPRETALAMAETHMPLTTTPAIVRRGSRRAPPTTITAPTSASTAPMASPGHRPTQPAIEDASWAAPPSPSAPRSVPRAAAFPSATAGKQPTRNTMAPSNSKPPRPPAAPRRGPGLNWSRPESMASASQLLLALFPVLEGHEDLTRLRPLVGPEDPRVGHLVDEA